jgi:hypothetical protein
MGVFYSAIINMKLVTTGTQFKFAVCNIQGILLIFPLVSMIYMTPSFSFDSTESQPGVILFKSENIQIANRMAILA